MDGQDNGLTLEDLAQRLEALERENAELRQEVSVLRGSHQTRPSEVAASEEPGTEFEGRVSRRDLLSKAGAAAVAAVAAGTLLNSREAKAHHFDGQADYFLLQADRVSTHRLESVSPDGHVAVEGDTTSDDFAAVYGDNSGSGPGVQGVNAGTGPAVEGTANGIGGTGVKGTGRFGVWGESNRAGFYGVTGRNINTDGTGVWGVGALRGVKGESRNGIGVHGDGPNGVYGTSSKTGYGAVYGKHTGSDGNGVVGDGTGGSAGVLGRNSGGIGIRGESSSGLGAIEGHNDGLGSGVVGVGRVGMLGFSHTDGWPAVWGRHTGNWAGISGDSAKGVGVYGESSSEGAQGVFGRAKGTSEGVAGESLNGTGVLGNGKTGVVGASTGGGYGGQFQGGKAQLKLAPKDTTGPPTGSHTKGEVYMDSTATLFVCVAGGNPATWRKVSTTAV